MDKVASHLLEPPVPADCLRLEFVPVLERDQSVAGFRLSQHSLFVVVLHCQSPPVREGWGVRERSWELPGHVVEVNESGAGSVESL